MSIVGTIELDIFDSNDTMNTQISTSTDEYDETRISCRIGDWIRGDYVTFGSRRQDWFHGAWHQGQGDPGDGGPASCHFR